MKSASRAGHLLAGGVLTYVLSAATASAALNVADVPLFLPGQLPPRVMLSLSKDHEMFKKAYPDYSDLTGDGRINSTYTDDFAYYGYFDAGKCYEYTSGRFEPTGAGGGPYGHHCSGEWSGNFLNWATMTRMDIVRRVLYGGYRYVDTETETVLQRELIPNSAHAFAKIFSGTSDADVSDVTPFSGTISMCNVTWPSSLSTRSENVDTGTNPPQLRVASGQWSTWSATEVRQCAWRNQKSSASPDSAHPVSGGSNDELGTFNVRVQVCRSDLLETNCRRYPSGHYKPAGLLQRYGEQNQIHFGLLTGSYEKNTSGGVLRRNIGPAADNTGDLDEENEIDPDTGVFANTGSGDQSIINAVNRLRITHWHFQDNHFDDDCSGPGISSISDNDCTNWGNPVGEMVLEALRYFGGASGPTSGFSTGSSDSRLSGLPHADEWRDPLPEAGQCANSSMILLSSGVSTHDAGTSASYGSASSIASLGSSSEVTASTNAVGTGESISGQYILGGSNQQCSAETISALSSAQGICPQGPSLRGGYDVAGLAYHAWTEDLRPEYTDFEQHVKTYAVNLSEPLPRLRFGDIELLPTCQSSSDSDGPWNTCNAVQTDVLDAEYDSGGNLVGGQFRTFWEDSTYGSDYDMDGAADLIVDMSGDDVSVTVDVVQAYAGFYLRFGFLASGSTQDGLSDWVVRPGGQNFSVIVNPSDNAGNQPASDTTVLTPGMSSAGLLRDPLWYAAKWGGFDKAPGDTPMLTEQWDTSGDGDPDNYYLVRNPARLEQDLEEVFADIISGVSSASSVATNSTRLDTETLIYQARFRSDDWTGEILAFGLEPDGSLGTLLWDVGDELPDPDDRNIFTLDDSGDGIAFEWDQLTSDQQTALDTSPGGVDDDLGEERLAWLRGDQSLELESGGGFRDRVVPFGDVVNSDPVFVGAQNFGYQALPSGTPGVSSYASFLASKIDTDGTVREPMLYVGSNDGMLHGFDAETGTERIAFVPPTLIPELNELPDPAYAHRYYVDGQIFVGDAYIDREGTDRWASVLVGSTGAGGKSVFALDVTDPDAFGAEDVMWEFTHTDLGNTIGEPTVARMADGTWAAVFGNGYNGDSEQASLFVVRLSDGQLLAKIDTGAGGSGNPNGLATPSLLADGTRTIQSAYAGDLLGNLWKFDLSDPNPANWDVAYSSGGDPAPLIVATDGAGAGQPITAPPELGRHPQGGYMVYFGTGKFFEQGDNLVEPGVQVQSFYGVRDEGGAGGEPITYVPGARGTALTEQEILFEGTPANSAFEVRVTSANPIDWTNRHGWYMDLESPTNGPEGERVVAAPILRGGRIIFPTLIPSPDPCGLGGGSWIMELDAVYGTRLSESPLDITEDGDIDSDDNVAIDIDGDGEDDYVPPSAVRSREGIVRTPAVISAGELEYKLASGTSGSVEVLRERGAFDRARGSWRQLR